MITKQSKTTLALLLATTSLGACVSESCPRGEVQRGDQCVPVDAGIADDAGGAGTTNGLGMDAGSDAARALDPNKQPDTKTDGSTPDPEPNGGAGGDDAAVVDRDAGADAAEPPETHDAGGDATTMTDVDAGPCGGNGYVTCWRDEDGDGVAPLGAAEMMLCGDCDDGWVSVEPATAANDCAPQDDSVYAGAVELCNDTDDDCDGSVDEGGTFKACSFDNGRGACVGGDCQLTGCNVGFDDCDGIADNGCEQPLDVDGHCGACDMTCTYANGSGACIDSGCTLVACDAGHDDCDGDEATGCEQPLDIDGHCGACNVTCTYVHGSGACVDSACALAGCDAGFDDCDGYEETGCEASLNMDGDCGACGVSCHELAVCDASEAVGSCACEPPHFGDGFDCVGEGPLAAGGYGIVCGIAPNGDATCWGGLGGTDDEPAGPFRQLSLGLTHVCGLKSNGSVDCWGGNAVGQADDQAGPFVQVGAGVAHTCALGADRRVACWGTPAGADDFGQDNPLDDEFVYLAVGAYHNCGLHADGTIECWGAGKMAVPGCEATHQCGQSLAPNFLAGRFVQITAGRWHSCGLRDDQSVMCWGAVGSSDVGQADPPEGVSFRFIAAGDLHTCGVTEAGAVECWGDVGGAASPQGTDFVRVYGGASHACVLDNAGEAACWGISAFGTVPSDFGGGWPLIP